MAKKKQKLETLKGPGGVEITTQAPAYDLNKAIQIWFGAPKTGKTSTLAALGTVAKEYDLDNEINPFVLLFEAGSGGVTLNCTVEECD